MNMSKSFARLATGAPHSEFQREKPQRTKRSSLDKLIIPRRTRLPSNKVNQVEPIDLQIAVNLLHAQDHARSTSIPSTLARKAKKMQASSDLKMEGSDEQQRLSQSSGSFYIRDYPSNGTLETSNQDRHSIFTERNELSSSSSSAWERQDLGMSYDGPNDFATGGSHATSITWPTISITATNVLRADPTESVDKYNALAKKHGLAPIEIMFDHGKLVLLA